jgi:hypothetical protein
MKDFTTYTLGQLLTHESQTIRRLAGSILKLLQRQAPRDQYLRCRNAELKKHN